MNELFELGKQAMAAQPFSRHIGAELTVFSEGRAELTIPVVEQLEQQNGFVHGGVLSYAADNALTFAGGSVLGPDVVTSEFKINYLRPGTGAWIVARATVLSASKTQAVCRCDIFAVQDEKEKLCAAAQGTISKMGGGSSR
jgi:uncharacterized protein (TIGR00369 family)